MEKHPLPEESMSIECDGSYEEVPCVYTCGSCQRTYQTISMLHEHLIDHLESGSYHYDNNSKTAFPKYDCECTETQTNVTESSPLVESKNVETQTLISCVMKCVETQTHETCLTNGHNDCVNDIQGMLNKSNEQQLNWETGDSDYQQSVAIKTEIIDACTNIDTDSVQMNNYVQYPNVNNQTKELVTSIKEEDLSYQQGDMMSAQEMHSTYFKSKHKTNDNDSEWSPNVNNGKKSKRGRPRKNPQSITNKTIQKMDETNSPSEHELKSAKMFDATNDVDDNNFSSDTDDYATKDIMCEIKNRKAVKIKHTKNDTTPRKKTTKMKHCTKCTITFSKIDLLRNHMSNVHGEQPWLCSKCGITLPTKAELKSHKSKGHYHGPVYKCSTCDITFESNSSLTKHKLEQHFSELSKYRCLECKKQFTGKGYYKIHMESLHCENPVLLICETCGFQTTKRATMKTHKEKHTEKKKNYACSKCSYKTFRKCRLAKHMVFHLDKKEHICYICGNPYQTAESLSRHLKKHSGVKPFKCELCPKAFIEHSGYRRHQLMHNEEKSYSCPYCAKTFVQKNNCSVHMRQHTGDKPYICDVCGVGFAHNVSKKNHMLKVHPGIR